MKKVKFLFMFILMMGVFIGSFASSDTTNQSATDTNLVTEVATTTEVADTATAEGSFSEAVLLDVADKLSLTIDTNLTAHEVATQVADAVEAAKGQKIGAFVVAALSLLFSLVIYFKRRK
jgi:zona occludens toxin (predicted ATPase)